MKGDGRKENDGPEKRTERRREQKGREKRADGPRAREEGREGDWSARTRDSRLEAKRGETVHKLETEGARAREGGGGGGGRN